MQLYFDFECCFLFGCRAMFFEAAPAIKAFTSCSWVLPKYTNINLDINLLGISEYFPEESAKPGLHKGCG